MGFKQAPSLPYSKLGYVEDGDYASRAYEKDEIIIWKGGNYFTKTDILQGTEFVVDTNLTAIPDGVLNGIMAKVSALSDHIASPVTTGARVSLSSGTIYTAETDGYAFAQSPSGTSAHIGIFDDEGNQIAVSRCQAASGATAYVTLFIPKGVKYGLSGTTYNYFIPLTK